ncbi:MAG: alpha/beta fold hydrolase [Chloroflexales bacterium]|nr:alpha/beta fold hydrolase [Chloroflexales bacterium]
MTPSWLDREAYPFASHFLELDGGAMHYVDEGAGEPILFVHGTPTWSFLYRHLIGALRAEHRCVAPDHIGFGLSAKPPGWGYGFADHARNLAALIDRLGLGPLTLVAHDLGGPIALSYALDNPGRVARLALFNTFMWPMEGEFAVPTVGRLFGGPVGRLLYLRLNASARSLLPMVYGDRAKLTPAIHSQYLGPFPRPDDRHGMFAFARQVAAGSTWCAGLWARRAALAGLPAQLIWGLKDPAFGPRYLARWREVLPQAQVLELPAVGHFPQEEAPEESLRALRGLLAAAPG